MNRFSVEQNIIHFERILATTTDRDLVRIVEQLLTFERRWLDEHNAAATGAVQATPRGGSGSGS